MFFPYKAATTMTVILFMQHLLKGIFVFTLNLI